MRDRLFSRGRMGGVMGGLRIRVKPSFLVVITASCRFCQDLHSAAERLPGTADIKPTPFNPPHPHRRKHTSCLGPHRRPKLKGLTSLQENSKEQLGQRVVIAWRLRTHISEVTCIVKALRPHQVGAVIHMPRV